MSIKQMKFINYRLVRTGCLTVILSIATFLFPLKAAEFNWSIGCTDPYWTTLCNGASCGPEINFRINNWGRSDCGIDPALPGVGDNVTLSSGPVFLLTNATITSLTLYSMASLTLTGASADLTLFGGLENYGPMNILDEAMVNFDNTDCLNSGVITLGTPGSGLGASFYILAILNITGTGQLSLYDDAEITGSGLLTNGVSHTINGGSAQITSMLNNQGSIKADVFGETLLLNSSQVLNSGSLEAAGGGILDIRSIVVHATGGIIQANSGTVNVLPTSSLTSCFLETSGSGVIQCFGSGTATFQEVTNTGDIVVFDGMTLSLTGSWLSNSGEITVSGAGGSPGFIDVGSTLGLTGNGIIRLEGGEIISPQFFSFLQNNGHEIRGFGTIHPRLTNQGVVSADIEGEVLNLRCSSGIVNNGILQAENSGILSVYCDVGPAVRGYPPTSSALIADGGTIVLNGGVDLHGMELATFNGGIISASGTNNITFDDVINYGDVDLYDGVTLNNSSPTLVNHGTISLTDSGTGDGASFSVSSSMEVTGSGALVIDSGSIDVYGASTLTNSANHTIMGRDEINGDLINYGMISATISGSTLTITPSGLGIDNYGWMGSDPGATLEIISPGQYDQFDSGTLIINGVLSFAGELELNGGSVRGDGSILGNLRNTEARVSPGNQGSGNLEVTGDYTQSSTAILAIEMSGELTPDFDVLDVGGSASLDGDLLVIPIDGFLPQPGHVFTVVTTNSISVTSLDIISSGSFSVSYAADEVTLTVLTSPYSPDHNNDGIVNMFDLAIQVGTPGGSRVGPVDMDGDAVVDLDDLLILVGNWGSSMQSN